MDRTESSTPSHSALAAFSVHVFTASGAACAFLALLAAVRSAWPAMFLWLGLALFIDGVDGTLARHWRIAEVLPRWSGEVLDLVVDILNYVFVPAYAMATSGLLPDSVALTLGLAITLTGTLYFADRRMKTDDHYFRGFPALWNVVAFYLFVLRPAAWLSAGLVAALAALTFVPVHFVHPVRIAPWRTCNLAALAVWSVLALAAVLQQLRSSFWVLAALCLLALYFIAIGLMRRRIPGGHA